jgi:sugar/nucleoside kinase (ribokinase family)
VAAAAFGRVGDDADGMFLGRSFREFGVSTSYMRVSTGTPSSAAMIMIEPSGEKALLYAPIPADAPDPDRLGEALARSSVVYATPYDFDELAMLSRLSRQRRVCVAIDLEALALSGIADLARWLALADLVFLNEAAFRSATGKAPGAESMSALLRCGPAAIVVTLGSAGALAATSNEFSDHAAFPARVVDTTGAGDCFAGAFITAALRMNSLDASLRFACAAASVAVTKIGARSGFPSRQTVDALLARSDASHHEHFTHKSKERNVC